MGLSNTLQAPGCWTVLHDSERHREVILDLKTHTTQLKTAVVYPSENFVLRFEHVGNSDLQWRADSDDLVTLCGINL